MNKNYKITIDGVDKTGSISDGYHTFDELYEHRTALFIALCKVYAETDFAEWGKDCPDVWRSKNHHVGGEPMYDGWFIMGIGKQTQISYHLPISKWEETNFAETLENAPKWDGHTPSDVIDRLKNL